MFNGSLTKKTNQIGGILANGKKMLEALEILVVDDDEATLHEVMDTLESGGYVCHGAQTIADACSRYFDSPRIGVIIVDIGLKGEIGLDLPEQVRGDALWRNPSFIFLTAYDQLSFVVRAMRVGAADYLVKPVSRQDLLDAVKRVVDIHVSAIRALNNAVADWSRRVVRQPTAMDQPSARSDKAPGSSGEAWPEAQSLLTAKTDLDESLTHVLQIRKDIVRQNVNFSPWDASIDILLELLAARQEDRILSATKLLVSRRLPQTTILRHIDKLAERGFIMRRSDPADRRRTILDIAEEGIAHVKCFADLFGGIVLKQGLSDRTTTAQ